MSLPQDLDGKDRTTGETAEPPLLAKDHLRLRPCRHGVMLYSLHDIYIGRSLEVYGQYAEDEAELYQRLLKPGQVAVEAGANIGAHTLVLAQAVGPQGMVVAAEPQRIVYQLLCANLALNNVKNVQARICGFGAEQATMRVPPRDYERDGNFGALSLAADGPGEAVSVLPIDSIGLKRCHLIKIDVEGMERAVLEGARETIARHRPALYVENNKRDQSPALISMLQALDYHLWWHIPRLYREDNFRGHRVDIFNNTININMLGLPAADPRKVAFKAIAGPGDWWKDE